MIELKDINAFTVILNEGDAYDKYVSQKRIARCIQRSKELFPKFKIYTKDDEIVKKALKKYKNYCDMVKTITPDIYQYISDTVRMTILNEMNDKALYVDTDIYIKNPYKLLECLNDEKYKNQTVFFDNLFCCVWNNTKGTNNNKIPHILNLYDNYKSNFERYLDYKDLNCFNDNFILTNGFRLADIYDIKIDYKDAFKIYDHYCNCKYRPLFKIDKNGNKIFGKIIVHQMRSTNSIVEFFKRAAAANGKTDGEYSSLFVVKECNEVLVPSNYIILPWGNIYSSLNECIEDLKSYGSVFLVV